LDVTDRRAREVRPVTDEDTGLRAEPEPDRTALTERVITLIRVAIAVVIDRVTAALNLREARDTVILALITADHDRAEAGALAAADRSQVGLIHEAITVLVKAITGLIICALRLSRLTDELSAPVEAGDRARSLTDPKSTALARRGGRIILINEAITVLVHPITALIGGAQLIRAGARHTRLRAELLSARLTGAWSTVLKGAHKALI
jgi:hypothetical protein